jgi:hypothetical protein
MDDDVDYWKKRSDYSLILLKIVDPAFYDEISSPNCMPRREQFLISAVSQIFMLLAEPLREQVVALPPPVIRKICSYDRSRIINIFLTRDLRPPEARRLFFARSSIPVQGTKSEWKLDLLHTTKDLTYHDQTTCSITEQRSSSNKTVVSACRPW